MRRRRLLSIKDSRLRQIRPVIIAILRIKRRAIRDLRRISLHLRRISRQVQTFRRRLLKDLVSTKMHL